MDPFSVLHSYLVQNDIGRKLHSDEKKDSIFALAKSFSSVRDKVENRINQMMQNDNNPLAKWMVRLSDEQRERAIDPSHVPQDPAHQICLVCGNHSINEPIKNEAVLVHNKKVDDVSLKKLKVWNDFLKQSEMSKGSNKMPPSWPTDPTEKNKVIKHTPTKGAYKCQVLQCMFAMSKCFMWNSDCCTTCPITCTNEQGQHCNWDDSSGCTCPICTSTCTAAYSVASFDQIAIHVSMLKLQKQAGLKESQFGYHAANN